MKRAEPLIALSREHHSALSLALRARRTARDGDLESVKRVSAEINDRFETELEPHFQEEERWLLPALSQAGENALVDRTLAEHAELRSLVGQLAHPGRELLSAFADALSAHVRFEERELFPAAERSPECLVNPETQDFQ